MKRRNSWLVILFLGFLPIIVHILEIRLVITLWPVVWRVSCWCNIKVSCISLVRHDSYSSSWFMFGLLVVLALAAYKTRIVAPCDKLQLGGWSLRNDLHFGSRWFATMQCIRLNLNTHSLMRTLQFPLRIVHGLPVGRSERTDKEKAFYCMCPLAMPSWDVIRILVLVAEFTLSTDQVCNDM